MFTTSNPPSSIQSSNCHHPNMNTTQPRHNLNTVVGLYTKMTTHTTPPHPLNGGLQDPHINIYWPHVNKMWQVTTSRAKPTCSCALRVHSDTFCFHKLVHHASKAQTKPKNHWLMRKIVWKLLKRASKRNFLRDIPVVWHKLGLWLVDAAQRTATRAPTSQNSVAIRD